MASWHAAIRCSTQLVAYWPPWLLAHSAATDSASPTWDGRPSAVNREPIMASASNGFAATIADACASTVAAAARWSGLIARHPRPPANAHAESICASVTGSGGAGDLNAEHPRQPDITIATNSSPSLFRGFIPSSCSPAEAGLHYLFVGVFTGGCSARWTNRCLSPGFLNTPI